MEIENVSSTPSPTAKMTNLLEITSIIHHRAGEVAKEKHLAVVDPSHDECRDIDEKPMLVAGDEREKDVENKRVCGWRRTHDPPPF